VPGLRSCGSMRRRGSSARLFVFVDAGRIVSLVAALAAATAVGATDLAVGAVLASAVPARALVLPVKAAARGLHSWQESGRPTISRRMLPILDVESREPAPADSTGIAAQPAVKKPL
jgi:hypothetical protein